ncbi:MAG: hypothetical protein JXQ83_09415 [Candidatus Glassbacteria bacterium]|nr:hypothetical protein [Candidatus Glassbacteria bacterium]
MEDVKEAVEDLIEETRLRTMSDIQVERRIRKFTELCEQMVSNRVADEDRRQQLIERLEIMKVFYNHSSVQSFYGGLMSSETGERQRNRRLSNIVKKRRMALRMIERTAPEVARAIEQRLEEELSGDAAGPGKAGKTKKKIASIKKAYPPLSLQHWYFLYFNLFLLVLLTGLIYLIVIAR